MKKMIPIFLAFIFILTGCATTAKMPRLKTSLTFNAVLELWGNPNEKIIAGSTYKNYPVELWEYSFKKGASVSGKKENWVLIFVDSELYLWAEDNPDKIFKELINLGVYDDEQLELLDSQESLQNTAAKAQETRRTMEIIRTHQYYQNTQMQIQTQQLMQIIRQQQLPPPPILPPVSPAKPIRQ